MGQLNLGGQLVAACRCSPDKVVIATKKLEGTHWVDTLYTYRPLYFADGDLLSFDLKHDKKADEIKAKFSKTEGRCFTSDNITVIGEKGGISNEVIVNTDTGESVELPHKAFTLPVNEKSAFVSFCQEDFLYLDVISMDKDSKLSDVKVKNEKKIQVGKSLVGTPQLLHTGNTVVFLNVTRDGETRISVFDTKLKTIVSESNLNEILVNQHNKNCTVSDIFLNEVNEKVWLYFEDKNKASENYAFLWDPTLPTDISKTIEVNKGKLVASIKSLSEYVQLIPRQIKEDFDKVNVKSVSSVYEAEFSELIKLDQVFGVGMMDEWWNRRRNSTEHGQLLIKQNADCYQHSLVCSTETNTTYVVGQDSRFSYKIKFLIPVGQYHLHETNLVILFQNGTLVEYELANGKLELVSGEAPRSEITDREEDDVDIYRARSMRAPRAKRAAMCHII